MPRFLALDADAHGLFVAAGSFKGKTLALEQTAAVAGGGPPLTREAAAELGGRLKELLKDAKIAPAPAYVVVGRDKVILKELRHPAVAPADEPAVIKFQAQKELSDAPDDVVIDYLPLGPTEDGEERRSMAVFVRKDVLAAARKMCETAGLKLAGLTPRPFAAAAALGRAWAAGAAPPPDAADAAVAVVSVTPAGGEFTVVRGGQVRFSRAMSAFAASSEAALVGELRRNLTVAAGPAGPVQAVYLAEADAPGGGWAGRLRLALPVPVFPFDPVAGARAGHDLPAELRGGFLGPVGLLAARAASAELPINFAHPRQPKVQSDPKRMRAMLAGLAAVVVLAVGLLAGLLMVDRADKKVADLRADVDRYTKYIEAGELDAKRVAAAEEFVNRGVNWLDEYYDLTVKNPDIQRMRVVTFEGKTLPPDTKTQTAAAPTKGGQPAAPVVPKKEPPKPVGVVSMTVTADEPTAQRWVDAIANDRTAGRSYYQGTGKTAGGVGGPGGRTTGSQFVITAQVFRRDPSEYRRVLSVSAPQPARPAGGRPGGGPGDDIPFGPGFGGGFPGGFSP